MSLPPYWGSTLRGVLGTALRKVTCSQQRWECTQCALAGGCAFPKLFSPTDHRGQAVPPPYFFQFPDLRQTEVPRGGQLLFDMSLTGRATELAVYMIAAMAQVEQLGLGRGRSKARLVGVDTITPDGAVPVYRYPSVLLASMVPATLGDLVPAAVAGAGWDSQTNRVVVSFLTMTRLISDGRLQGRPEFELVIRATLRRVVALVNSEGGGRLDLDFQGVVKEASRVTIIEDQTRWQDWERYSSRQDTRMRLGGLLGHAVYAGWLQPFASLLTLAELVHVGKNVAFGLGRVRVQPGTA